MKNNVDFVQIIKRSNFEIIKYVGHPLYTLIHIDLSSDHMFIDWVDNSYIHIDKRSDYYSPIYNDFSIKYKPIDLSILKNGKWFSYKKIKEFVDELYKLRVLQ